MCLHVILWSSKSWFNNNYTCFTMILLPNMKIQTFDGFNSIEDLMNDDLPFN